MSFRAFRCLAAGYPRNSRNPGLCSGAEGPRLVEEVEVGSLGLAPNASCDRAFCFLLALHSGVLWKVGPSHCFVPHCSPKQFENH